jgi:hypothetical protein
MGKNQTVTIGSQDFTPALQMHSNRFIAEQGCMQDVPQDVPKVL